MPFCDMFSFFDSHFRSHLCPGSSTEVLAWAVQVKKEPYVIGPLTGFYISSSGFQSSEREVLEDQIKSGGGTYTPDLYRSCSHLVTRMPTGAKYRCCYGSTACGQGRLVCVSGIDCCCNAIAGQQEHGRTSRWCTHLG